MFFVFRTFLSQNLIKTGFQGEIRDQLGELYPTMEKYNGVNIFANVLLWVHLMCLP